MIALLAGIYWENYLLERIRFQHLQHNTIEYPSVAGNNPVIGPVVQRSRALGFSVRSPRAAETEDFTIGSS
jgi:hypothetical protein